MGYLNSKFLLNDLFLLCLLSGFSPGSVASGSHKFPNSNQAQFINSLSSYEIVFPIRVHPDGSLMSHYRAKRSAEIHYEVKLDGQAHIVSLYPNTDFISPGMLIESWGATKTRRALDPDNLHCHFIGSIQNHSTSVVALSTCYGLRGYLRTSRDEFFIEPVVEPRNHDNAKQTVLHGQRHLVYRRSALPQDGSFTARPHSNKPMESHCYIKEGWDKREQWESQKIQKKKRTKRSVSTERNVETLVVADQAMTEFYHQEDLETYLLTIFNMVSKLYRDASIGNAINIVLVRIIIFEDEKGHDDLEIDNHADNTLKSFCRWQYNINPKEESDLAHHDVAILVTRNNICTNSHEPCSTLGLAEVAGMCQPERSCNVNEDTGLALAYTIAHEMGHNFGASHDGPHNGCEAPFGEKQHVMSPHLICDTNPIVWSNCSRQEITKFLDRDWGECLNDKPTETNYVYPDLPPGAMYNADHQCRLQYGVNASHCDQIDEQLCQTLWCRVDDNRCVTRLEPPAAGTSCGYHMWCQMGECTLMSDRPIVINGEWGEWSPWSECSRTCGAGIETAERFCDNPKPQNGGQYCIGERKRYRVCKAEECPEDEPSFRAWQCQRHNDVPYKGELYSWLPVQNRVTPCQLHCKPDGKFFSVMLSDTVIDGTLCNPGKRDMCIGGKCKRVACDWVIDSNAEEDRCGICHGDGTQCDTIRGLYDQLDGNGYSEIVVLPAGARNILIEEVGTDINYLSLRGVNESHWYLNGDWVIQWSGEYHVAGTLMYYRRDNEQETIHIPGPIKSEVHVMILFQEENSGVKYEFTIPHENATRIPEFHWEYTDWSICTATCGGGLQISRPKCVEKEAGLVEETYCAGLPKPPVKRQPCNSHLCPAEWWAGPWQDCSVTCGRTGIRYRTVICVRLLKGNTQIAMNDSDCEDLVKPKEVEACPKLKRCPQDVYWETGPWSHDCNDDPCNMQTRKVWCSQPTKCEQHLKPIEERQCGNITCGRWEFGNWSQCNCQHGYMIRNVTCVGGLACRTSDEPSSLKSCSDNCTIADLLSFETPTDAPPASVDSTTLFNEHIKTESFTVAENITSSIQNGTVAPRDLQVAVDTPALDDIKIVEMELVPSGKERNFSASKTVSIHYGLEAIDLIQNITGRIMLGGGNLLDGLSSKYDWNIDSVSKCSRSCGDGHQIREVHCYDLEQNSIVSDTHCVTLKPSQNVSCTQNDCQDWKMSPWSPCSETCDKGTKSRQVMCPEEGTCDMDKKPENKTECIVRPCIEWVVGHWSPCSATCGGGYQTRIVRCIDHRTRKHSHGCNRKKAHHKQKCNLEPCVNKPKQAKLKLCYDKLDKKLCRKLQHLCGTFFDYFKVNCCRTCSKYTKKMKLKKKMESEAKAAIR